jgi:hypothetical protein
LFFVFICVCPINHNQILILIYYFLFVKKNNNNNNKRSGYEYVVPQSGPITNYTAVIETLPLASTPQVFGLHPNAEIRYNSDAVKELWKNLVDLQPRRFFFGLIVLFCFF